MLLFWNKERVLSAIGRLSRGGRPLVGCTSVVACPCLSILRDTKPRSPVVGIVVLGLKYGVSRKR